MAEPTFPWEMYMQAADRKNQNRQDMNANIAGLGQNLGGALGSIGGMIDEEKKKKIVQQILQAMQTQGAPQQGPPLAPPGTQPSPPPPNLSPGPGVPSAPPGGQQSMMPPTQIPPGQPMSAGLNNIGQDVQMSKPPQPQPQPVPTQGPGAPTSGIGALPQDNSKLIQNLLMQYDPQGAIQNYMAQRQPQDPYKAALTQQALATAEKERRAPSGKNEWAAYPGTFDGKPAEIDKVTGEVKPVNTGGKYAAPAGMGSAMATERHRQFGITDLPWNMGASTPIGAAFQVKMAAHQGKALIAKAGSPQRTGLSSADLVRAVARVAPTDEMMTNANFSNNVITNWATLKQKITADPSAVDNPKIRKEIFDVFDEMDNAATPFIKDQIDTMNEGGYPISDKVRARALGTNLPDIPFQEGSGMPPGRGGSQQIGRFQVTVH